MDVLNYLCTNHNKMKEKTAVEILINQQINWIGENDFTDYKRLVFQLEEYAREAKTLEQQQVEKAYQIGFIRGLAEPKY